MKTNRTPRALSTATLSRDVETWTLHFGPDFHAVKTNKALLAVAPRNRLAVYARAVSLQTARLANGAADGNVYADLVEQARRDLGL